MKTIKIIDLVIKALNESDINLAKDLLKDFRKSLTNNSISANDDLEDDSLNVNDPDDVVEIEDIINALEK